ncbi:hypothetical protein H5410_060551 [Solanum commersonii]|uniref:Cytochrome P450 n=1 Tax=Solanum commersonii TaxID=4109 RepID=A0A9J5W5R4_SOLCO|nr:hypothetical protein H5410_060551 [Solanum commersonii]
MTTLAAKYKTYRLESLFRREIYTSDPVLEDYYGDGVFAVDGDKWKEQRKLSSPDFSKRVLRDVNSIVFRRNAAKLANILYEAANSNNTVDIQDLLLKSSMDSLFQVAFGIELESVCRSMSELSFWRYIDLFWRIKKVLNIGSEAKLKRSGQILDWYIYNLISTKTEQLSHDHQHDSSRKEENILSRFWHYSTTNPKYLRDILVNFMGGGKDTTGMTLAWFIWSLCKHPQVQEKVALEIKDAAKSNIGTTISDFASHLNEEAMDKMYYLQAVLSETFRTSSFYSIESQLELNTSCRVPQNFNVYNDVLPDGYNVNKGDMVAYQPYAMGRMSNIWGDDAQEFKLERWIDENGSFKQESPSNLPFSRSAGPRICIGKEFAYRQMKITAAVLLRFFIFKLADGSRPVTYKTMIQLHIAGGLHVRAMQRIDQN